MVPVAFAIPLNNSLIEDSPKEVLDQVWQIIYRDYMDSTGKYDPSNWIRLRKKLLSNKYHNYSQVYDEIEAMLLTLEDPYTRFLDPKQFDEMKIDTSGQLTGVGIQIAIDDKTKNIVVISPIEGTPAFKAGVKAKDIIFSIDGKNTEGMSIDNVVKLIRGKEGTKVLIGFQRGNKSINISLVREKIEIRTVSTKRKILNNGMKISYIRLKTFSANASKEMNNAIKSAELHNTDGYIIDLRGNPGGLLEASIEISRQFLDKGIIVSTQTRNGIKNVRRARNTSLTKKPIAILVNEGSASASEILSGAIQDNKRGILVGNKTFGKGLVQSVKPLIDGSGLTVTVAKYLTPNGVDINKNGIKPDIKVNLILKKSDNFSISDLGSSIDNQYTVAENALVQKINQLSNIKSYVPGSANLEKALNK
ncbi:S41 family peptidase [Prochlorococcus marinus]|uniref:S41 family peptidase n=1 Tax=Prochlorococcus marinus TaxID=1219 RepID=UPI0022B45182|nr:S41 family peptidase [Prochlorococcus marinus]